MEKLRKSQKEAVRAPFNYYACTEQVYNDWMMVLDGYKQEDAGDAGMVVEYDPRDTNKFIKGEVDRHTFSMEPGNLKNRPIYRVERGEHINLKELFRTEEGRNGISVVRENVAVDLPNEKPADGIERRNKRVGRNVIDSYYPLGGEYCGWTRYILTEDGMRISSVEFGHVGVYNPDFSEITGRHDLAIADIQRADHGVHVNTVSQVYFYKDGEFQGVVGYDNGKHLLNW